jgi:MFS family permease
VVTSPRQAVATLASALRNRNIRRAEVAWGAAIAAEWAHFVAFGVFAYDTGGAAAVGLAGLVRLLPAAIVAPFAASLGDRFRRERFLLALMLLAGAGLAGSAVAFFLDAEVAVFALAAVLGLAVTLIRPALQALLPSLARTPQELIASNGATSTIESLGTLAGPLLAGLLVAVGSPGIVFATGAGALVLAAAALARVTVEGAVGLTSAVGEGGVSQMILAGFRALAKAPRPRLVIGLMVAQTFVRGCLNVLIVVVAFQVLGSGGAVVGYLTAAIGFGGLAGALGAMALQQRRLAVPFGLSLVLWGLPIAVMGRWPDLAAAVVLLAVVGAANSVEDVAGFTLLQRLVPDRLLTRVLGLFWSLAMGGVALGSITAPALVEAVGARWAFVAVGAILPVLALASYTRLLAIDRSVAPAPELELLDRVPMFAPLSLAAKERVAAGLVPVHVSAGDHVIRAGAVGDRFYIVVDGELDVSAPGVAQKLGRLDYFGEIALLRNVPRTATVTATVDSELLALERDDFLGALTGHRAARAAADAVADTRLAHAGS